jgi:hypothetical protein
VEKTREIPVPVPPLQETITREMQPKIGPADNEIEFQANPLLDGS